MIPLHVVKNRPIRYDYKGRAETERLQYANESLVVYARIRLSTTLNQIKVEQLKLVKACM